MLLVDYKKNQPYLILINWAIVLSFFCMETVVKFQTCLCYLFLISLG